MSFYGLKRHEITLRDSELKQFLLPHLKNNIFHITPYLSFLKIVKSGMLKPSMPLSAIGRTNSFGRAKEWISFFDLRDKDDNTINDSLQKLNFLVPSAFGDRCLFLLLSEGSYSKLITAPADYDYTYMKIPRVEAFYPEPLPLTEIACVIDVKVIRSVPSQREHLVWLANKKTFSR